MRKLIQNNRGETLIEVLAAILISVLSVTLLFSSVLASYEAGKKTRELDSGFYAGLSEADAQVTSTPTLEPGADPAPVPTGTVKITLTDPAPKPEATQPNAAPTIEIYGDAGTEVYSYKEKQP